MDASYIASGPVVLWLGEQTEGCTITPRKVAQNKDIDLSNPYISIHFSGSKDDLDGLDHHLGRVAKKLLSKKEKLPEYIVGITSRDMTHAVATRYDDIVTYNVDITNLPGETSNDAVWIADAARMTRGHGALPDSKLYAVAMPTDTFLDTFSGQSLDKTS